MHTLPTALVAALLLTPTTSAIAQTEASGPFSSPAMVELLPATVTTDDDEIILVENEDDFDDIDDDDDDEDDDEDEDDEDDNYDN